MTDAEDMWPEIGEKASHGLRSREVISVCCEVIEYRYAAPYIIMDDPRDSLFTMSIGECSLSEWNEWVKGAKFEYNSSY